MSKRSSITGEADEALAEVDVAEGVTAALEIAELDVEVLTDAALFWAPTEDTFSTLETDETAVEETDVDVVVFSLWLELEIRTYDDDAPVLISAELTDMAADDDTVILDLLAEDAVEDFEVETLLTTDDAVAEVTVALLLDTEEEECSEDVVTVVIELLETVMDALLTLIVLIVLIVLLEMIVVVVVV